MPGTCCDVVARDQSLYLGEVRVANFGLTKPQVFCTPERPDHPRLLRVEVQHMGRSTVVELDLNAQILPQLQEQIPTCRLLRESCRGAVEDVILSLAAQASERPLGHYFTSHGLHHLPDGRWVYVSGCEVLGLGCDEAAAICPEVARAKPVWDAVFPPVEATGTLCRLLERQASVLLPVWGYTLVSASRSLIAELGLTTFPALYVSGRQGWGKTTVLRRFALLWDDVEMSGQQWASLDASSTPASVMECVGRFRDQVVLVDDLARSSDRAVEKQRLGLIARMLRFASNESERTKIAPGGRIGSHRCRAGVAFTGEIPLTSASDLTRIVMVELKEPMSGGGSRERVIAATVFRGFLEWLLPQMDAVRESLAQSLRALPEGRHGRLRTSRLLLQWALDLFYRFAVEVGAVTEGYRCAALARLETALTDLIGRQADMVDRLEWTATPRGNLSWYLLEGYRKNCFRIVRRKHIQTNSDCVLEKDALCLRTETLLAFFRMETPNGGLTEQQMTRQLRREGVLGDHAEKRAATKKIYGKRYIALSLAALNKAAIAY